RGPHVLASAALLCLRALNLFSEYFVIALRLIQLLRRCRLLVEQTLQPLVVPVRDLLLHAECVELLTGLRNARCAAAPLRRELSVLQRELRGIDDTEELTRRDVLAFVDLEPEKLPTGLRRDDD